MSSDLTSSNFLTGLFSKRAVPRAQRRQQLKRKGRATVVVSRKIAQNHKYLAAHGLPHSPRMAALFLGSRSTRRTLNNAL